MIDAWSASGGQAVERQELSADSGRSQAGIGSGLRALDGELQCHAAMRGMVREGPQWAF